MTRPPEYENLIRTRAFDAVLPTAGAVAGYLKNARDYLEVAKGIDASKSLQVFTLEVRTKDGGRNLAIQRVSQDLKLSTGEFEAVRRAHERRNNTSYISPFPPVSKAEAAAMIAILTKYLPAAYALTGVTGS